MANDFFQTQLGRARSHGLRKRFSKKSIDWFQDQVKGLRFGDKQLSRNKLLKDEKLRTISNPAKYAPGRMYMYFYDPKHKETLPYYDAFPLILLVDSAPGGMLTLNLHYLPITLRVELMSELLKIRNQEKFNRDTRIKLSYDLLNGASKYKAFKPCIKHHLFSQIKSNIREIPSDAWEVALFLPTQKFVGASANKVWADSKRIMKG